MADFKYSAGIDVNLNVKGASNQLKDLQKQLQQISNMKVDIGTGNLTADIEKASEAAMKLSAHLATATNPQTGNLDFTKFYTSIQKSGASLEDYGKALQNMGPAGQKAFVSLADSISKAEIPLKRTSKLVDGMWDNLKKTIGWQMSSSMVHGFIGSMQQAMGYAKDLNKSLTDIRIVTGTSSDQMAQFAKEANKAAKSLSTTTTDYTKASLIYYQQGLSDQEVKARTETTIKMANATGTSAQKVSDQMTAIWNNFDNGTKSLTHYADVMTALGAATASSTDEIAEGLQKFASISDTVGLSYEYAASALATITSTSRESADVVGNSLKTLFSRIQGLQLGETLDDGTTLNKYSTAMAKVGISIKDSSGELKDMDTILNEMGTKWQTLANDEKMALAQTVAGVRQYTQLMTLMENWDQFKSNLNVANTSGGTLDAQAAIYAESWEAASDRVRASWESLWDNLINSDGFIAALDLASGFIGMIDNMITGLGGASGAFLTFGGVLSKVFNKQIANTISDIGYNISMLTGSGQKKMLAAKDDFVTKAMKSVDRDMPITLGKEYESKAIRSSMEQSLGLSMLYSQNAGRLSEQQLMTYNAKKKMLEQVQQEAIEAGSRYDQSRAKRGDLFWKLADNDMAYNTGLGAAIPEKINPEQQSKTRLAEIDAELAEKQKQLDRHNREDVDGLFALSNQIKTLTDEKKALLSGQQSSQQQTSDFLKTTIPENIKETLESKQADIDNLINQNKELLGDKTEQDFLGSRDEKLKEKQEKYKQNKEVIEANTASKNYIETQSRKKIQTYSDALIRQAEQTVNLQQKLNAAFSNNDENSLLNGLNEFASLSANNLEGNKFIQGLNKVLNKEFAFADDGTALSLQEQLNKAMGGDFASALVSFQKTSMDTIGGKIWGQLSEERKTKAGFESKEDFLSALRDSYLGTEIADADRKRKAEEAARIAAGLQDDLLKEPEESISGAQRLVLGASGVMEAVAAGEALNTTINSFVDGTATFSSAISGMASTTLNAASGFDSIKTALTGLCGISASTAGWIGLAVTALGTLLPLIIDFVDKANVSDKEHAQNLIDSSNELATFASTTEQHLENVKTQNEDYLKGVEKIKSLDQDPATLAEDIYESNKKAFELIDQYGLAEDQYTRAGNGLIEISKDVLQTYGENIAEQSKITADYANVLGQAAINKEQAERAFSEAESKKADVLDYLVMPTQNYNAEYGNTLYHQQMQKYNSLTNEGREILKGIIGEEALTTGAISAERIANAINSGEWDRLMGEVTSNQSQFDAIKQMGLDYNNTSSDQERANIMYDSAARIASSKMLADAGYDVNEDGYSVKSEILAEKMSAAMQSQMPWLDTKSTAELTGDNLEIAKRLIAQTMGISASDIKDVGVDEAGQITYKYGDDSTPGDPISRQTLNTWKATEEVLKQQGSLIDKTNEQYDALVQEVGEAGAHIQQLGTVSGASADSVKELYEQGDKAFKEKYGEGEDAQKTATEEYDKVARIFDPENGIGSKLSSEVLENVDMGVLEALQNVMDVDEASAQGVMDLFEGVQSITGDTDPEKAAKLLTALSQMDFSENAYLNASNLLSVLEDLGYNVNEGSLPTIYAWLAKITGLAPGSEDFADTNSKISKNRGALNGIEPGGKLDTDKKEAAEKAGLVGDWVKTGEDEYTYTGTQDQIDAAKSFQNEAWARNQMAIDAGQVNKDRIAASGLKGDYNSITDVAKALDFGINTSGQVIGAGGANADLVEDILGLNPDTLLNMMNSDPQAVIDMINSMVNGSVMNDKTQATGAEDFMANIQSTTDMMNAIGESKARGDTAGFTENGLLSDEAVNRMKSFTDTSQQYQSAMSHMVDVQEQAKAGAEAYIEAESELQALKESNIENTAREQQLQEEMAANKEQYDIYTEAQAQSELALAIESVANARGLDADSVARYADQFQEAVKAGELTSEVAASMAADLAVQAEGLKECAKNGKEWLNAITQGTKGTQKYEDAFSNLSKSMAKVLKIEDQVTKGAVKMGKAFEQWTKKNPGKVAKAMAGDLEAGAEAMEQIAKDTYEGTATTKEGENAWNNFATTTLDGLSDIWKALDENGLAEAGTDISDAMNLLNEGASTVTEGAAEKVWDFVNAFAQGAKDMKMSGADFKTGLSAFGFDIVPVTAEVAAELQQQGEGLLAVENEVGFEGVPQPLTAKVKDDGSMKYFKIVSNGGPGGGSSGGSGGGGGGGGAKEPKKVANKRKSQTVARYKRSNLKRSSAEKSKKSETNKKDYLYGETKIAQMEKINKLAEKEAKITKDRIQESQKYLVEDRNNIIKYMQKYGFEAEFDSEGFLKNYEQVWSKIYEEIAALYEDNLLTEDEEKIEEDLNIKLEELEGVLEDYENSLEELANDIEKYEESLYEQYDNKIDAIQHKVEFKIELNEDDIEYIDFLLEVLGDTASYSVNRIELINQKMDALFNSISTIKEGIAEIYDISNDELQVFATGGLNIEGLLTEAQVEKLRELRDQLMEEMQSLIKEYQKAMEEPLTVFDSWTEKIDHSIAIVEHYSNILSQLRNVIDITGRDMYGFTDTFMRNLETITISQSLDTIAVNREYYESLIAQQAEAEAGLMQAREQGDEATIAKWEEIVRTTTEAAQSAREALVSGLENTLTLISDQFTVALEDAVKNFNDALYTSGGLEGLSNDYSLMREHADLMAADYDKIYNLSKLTRNINKSLDDTKIIAGKQKLNSLLEEINALQATGVELSKYDLEYLEAKYNLYLAQIELENARNAKDTVTLSRDSEGNWAYVYTSNEEKIAEAEQKYEDALYEMQNKNHEYMEEMSSNMIAMTQQMQEEMAELNPADFANPEEYQQALQEIQDKYDKLLKAQNDELNKAIENNASLYETDWKNYSRYTGYKISDDEKWIDSFKETTLGHLIGSDSMDSDFQNIVYKLTTELSKGLSEAAVNYFKGIDEALKTYGTSIDEFGSNIINTTTSIRMESIEVGESIEDMASKMQTAFKDAADALKAFQETRLPEITTQLGEISTIISQINKDIRDSANIINDKDTSLIGDSKAVDLLNESGLFGTWTYNKRGDMDIVDENGNKTEGTNFQAYNAKLIEELDKARSDYQEGKITKEDLDEMYERYWMFKDIINRIYNSDNLVDPPAAFDTGGYTGEWGNAGKLAMLHQKELILNPDDTENFLEAIKLTKDMMSVLDFQIQYAKLGMGVLEAYDLQHQPSETVIEQQVTIQAEFPNVSDHNEVEEAIYNLINTASQYANRQ